MTTNSDAPLSNDLEHDTSFDHLDHEQLMNTLSLVRKEAYNVVEQGRSVLESVIIHNQDPESHPDLRHALNELVDTLADDIAKHNIDETSHPYILSLINKLNEDIQKIRDGMIPAINSAIITHNVDPNAHEEAIGTHDVDPNAHAALLEELKKLIQGHDESEDAHSNLFEYLRKADLYRYSRIGEIMPGNIMADYAEDAIIPADGRIININSYPELKQKIERGHIYVRQTYDAAFPGLWTKYDDEGNYRVPNTSSGGNRVLRFSTTADQCGYAENDTTTRITGLFSTSPSYFARFPQGIFYAQQYGVSYAGTYGYGLIQTNVGFDNALQVPTSAEVRVKCLYQYPVIYLGSKA